MTAHNVYDIFPYLIPQNTKKTIYDGYLDLAEQNYRFRLELNDLDDLKGIKMFSSSELEDIFKQESKTIQKVLNQSSNLQNFLIELKHILERRIKTIPPSFSSTPPEYYVRLIHEIKEIKWENISFINSNMNELHINIIDLNKRTHSLEISLHPKYPNHPPKCNMHLPIQEDKTFNWNASNSTLIQIVEYYQQLVEKFQNFWNIMDDLDHNVKMMETTKHSRADTKRRLLIEKGKFTSLFIDVDPLHPSLMPQWNFLGAEIAVKQLKNKLASSLSLWSNKKTIRENLQKILNLKFPSPEKKDDIDEMEELRCEICYASDEFGEQPDVFCDGENCGKVSFYDLLLGNLSGWIVNHKIVKLAIKFQFKYKVLSRDMKKFKQ